MLPSETFLAYLIFAALALHGSFPLLLYIIHTPHVFDGSSLYGILTYGVLPLLEAGAILLLAYGFEETILDAEDPLVALAVGVGVWGLGLLGVGLLGVFNQKGLMVSAAVVFIVGARSFYQVLSVRFFPLQRKSRQLFARRRVRTASFCFVALSR